MFNFFFFYWKRLCKIQRAAFEVISSFNYVSKYLAENTNFKQFIWYILLIDYILSFHYNICILENFTSDVWKKIQLNIQIFLSKPPSLLFSTDTDWMSYD